MIRNVLIALCFVSLLLGGSRHAHGLDPSKRLTQYRHSMWRIQDGFLPGSPFWVSQTTDGYLWTGGRSIGAIRFDGVRFVPWSSPDLNSKRIDNFLPAKNGGFWISDGRGLNHLRGTHIVSRFDLGAPSYGMKEEDDGSVWVAMSHPSGARGPLCHATDREIRCFGESDGLPIRRADSIVADGGGGFWIGSDTSLVHWKGGSSDVYEPKGLRSNSGQEGVRALVRNADGSLWVGISEPGRGLGLERFSNGSFKPLVTRDFDSTKLEVLMLLQDRDSALWVATNNNGLYRIYGTSVDHFGKTDGLSSDSVLNLYEDQEGLIWAVTSNGLDSFEESRVTTYSATEGLGSDEAVSIVATHDGTVWLANHSSLDRIRDNTVSSIRMKDGLPGRQVTSLLEDHNGHLWVGVDDGLYLYENRHFQPVNGPNRGRIGMVVGIAEDVDGDIWAECVSKQRKLIRIRDSKVQEEWSESQIPPGHTLAADPRGGIWLATLDGRLVRLRKGKSEVFPLDLKGYPVLLQLEAEQDGSVTAAATEDGLISVHAGFVQRLTKQNGLPCDGVSAFTRDNSKNWWFATPCGYVEIADSEIQKWRLDPKAVLQIRFLDTFDGARTRATSFNPAATSRDGRLWFVNGLVAQTIDPTRLTNASRVRPVYVESVTADRRLYAAQDRLTLPALTHDIQIDYTSPSLAVPQKATFRYRLEGNESAWEDAGTRRQAFYNNLRPGQYRFTVIASNEDGIWSTQGATLQFSVAPAWFQTGWFRAFCVGIVVLLMWTIYQFHLRQLRRQFAIALEARVNERTRIARELHDTLLQNFHGALFQFQAARNLMSREPDQAVQSLDDAISETKKALAESREAIQGLRSEPIAKGNLAELLMLTSQELAGSDSNEHPPVFDLIEEGERRALSSTVSSEVCRIALELLRNVYQHAQAQRIEAEIRYGDSTFRLRIRDDGRGIDPKVLKEGGRVGHWGLRGIRERADRIGAHLDVWSEPRNGTEVQLELPAAIAYESLRDSDRAKLAREVKSHAKRS